MQDNGGPTFTHALLPGSPAINAGNPATPGSGGNACESTDQRGAARPTDLGCDIGAFELVPVADLQVSKTSSRVRYTPGKPLSYTLTVTNMGTADATSVVLTDVLPLEVSFVSSTPGAPTCVEVLGTITCNLGELAVDASKIVNVEVLVSSTTSDFLVNTASATHDESNLDPGSNQATNAIPIPGMTAWGLIGMTGLLLAAFLWAARPGGSR